MNWTLWHNGDCSKSRAAQIFLRGLGIEPQIVHYLDGSLRVADIDQILGQLGMEPEQLVRKGDDLYATLGLATSPPARRAEWLNILAKNPLLIERPLISNGIRAVVGRPVTRILELLPKPKLEAPGAGLPFLQRILVRGVVGPYLSKKADLKKVSDSYERITQKVLKEVRTLDPVLWQVPVLVTPIRGLEDSSRYWSLIDVMEHLLIVTTGVEQLVKNLDARENGDPLVKPILDRVETARVKPRRVQSAEEVSAQFERDLPGLSVKLLSGLSDQVKAGAGLKFTHLHPWMGPFNARQWYWLLGAHHQIHWQQTKQIVAGLRVGSLEGNAK